MSDHSSVDLPGGVKLVEKEYLILDQYNVFMAFITLGGGSFLIWIGEKNGPKKLTGDLALALSNDATSIITSGDLYSQSLAKKLSVKYNENKPVYVSYNYPDLTFSKGDFFSAVNQKVVEFVNLCVSRWIKLIKAITLQ